MNTCSYTYRKANFMQPTLTGYWVMIYLLFDGSRTYTFLNESEWLDNGMLISESGSVHSFCKEILVTPTKFSSIYSEIADFENVLKSNLNKEC